MYDDGRFRVLGFRWNIQRTVGARPLFYFLCACSFVFLFLIFTLISTTVCGTFSLPVTPAKTHFPRAAKKTTVSVQRELRWRKRVEGWLTHTQNDSDLPPPLLALVTLRRFGFTVYYGIKFRTRTFVRMRAPAHARALQPISTSLSFFPFLTSFQNQVSRKQIKYCVRFSTHTNKKPLQPTRSADLNADRWRAGGSCFSATSGYARATRALAWRRAAFVATCLFRDLFAKLFLYFQ